MSTNNFLKTDLYYLYNVTQNTIISSPKELVIATLREFFAKDSMYHYVKDQWGFPETPDHTGLPQDAGYKDDSTTRLYIGENYRQNIVYYPALIIKHNGTKFTPISFNDEKSSVQWEFIKVVDSYNNTSFFRKPSAFIYAGAWEGSIEIDIYTRSLSARDELAGLVAILFANIAKYDLQRHGLIIKSVNVSGPSDDVDRNDKLFKCSVTLEIRSEWRREIPISKLIEVINFVVDFGRVDTPNYPVAQNLRISISETLADYIIQQI